MAQPQASPIDEGSLLGLHELDVSLEGPEARQLAEAVDSYLSSFRWARRTGRAWVGATLPGILGLFLVELDPPSDDVDRFIWVVVGDLPPAYISWAYAETRSQAIECYIAEMRAWVKAVEDGASARDLIPVNGAETPENAVMLKSRLDFIEAQVLPDLALL